MPLIADRRWALSGRLPSLLASALATVLVGCGHGAPRDTAGVPHTPWVRIAAESVSASVLSDRIEFSVDAVYDNRADEVRFVRRCALSVEGLENGVWRPGWARVCAEESVDSVPAHSTRSLPITVVMWTRPRMEPRWRLASPPRTLRLALVVSRRNSIREPTLVPLVAEEERVSNPFLLAVPEH